LAVLSEGWGRSFTHELCAYDIVCRNAPALYQLRTPPPLVIYRQNGIFIIES